MKKVLSLFLIVFGGLLLVACQKEEKVEYFTAFSEKAPVEGAEGGELTWVTVGVDKDGKIVSFYIDVLQLKDGVYNEKSKKELGDEYAMKNVGPGYKLVDGAWVVEGKSQKEWFEQAALIEAKWLADGFDSVTTLDGRIDNVAGVTIKDGSYIMVAKSAVEAAKAGVQPELPTQITSRLD